VNSLANVIEPGALIATFGLDRRKIVTASRLPALAILLGTLAPQMFRRPATIPISLLLGGAFWTAYIVGVRWFVARTRVAVHENGIKLGEFVLWSEISNIEVVPGDGVIIWKGDHRYRISPMIDRSVELREVVAKLLGADHKLTEALAPNGRDKS
jgi:hypothetical protein